MLAAEQETTMTLEDILRLLDEEVPRHLRAGVVATPARASLRESHVSLREGGLSSAVYFTHEQMRAAACPADLVAARVKETVTAMAEAKERLRGMDAKR